MTTLMLKIQSPGECEQFSDVISFSGRDSSGSFGILPHAERRVTVLTFGLASFRRAGGSLEFLALPGGLLYFRDNSLAIATQNYVRSNELRKVTAALQEEIRASETALADTRRSLRRLDEEILKRLSRLNWRAAT